MLQTISSQLGHTNLIICNGEYISWILQIAKPRQWEKWAEMKKHLKRTKELLCLHNTLKTRGRHTKAVGNTQRPLAKPSAPDNYLNKSKKVYVSWDIWPSIYHFTHFALTNWYITIAKCFYISSIWCATFPGRSRHVLLWVPLLLLSHRPCALVSGSLDLWAVAVKMSFHITIHNLSNQCGTASNDMKRSINKLQMETIISGMFINIFYSCKSDHESSLNETVMHLSFSAMR